MCVPVCAEFTIRWLTLSMLSEAFFSATNATPSGARDTCKSSLAFGIAMSLIEWKLNWRVINCWEPLMSLCSVLKTCVKCLCYKKNKARWEDYEKTMNEKNREAMVVTIPNATRAGGAQFIIKKSLRSLHSFRFYVGANEHIEEKMILASQWNQITDFSGETRPAFDLFLTSQTNRIE